MSTERSDWQRQVHQAFEFIYELYLQAAALFDDAQRKYADLGWPVLPRLGGVAYSADVQTTKGCSPYVYFKGIVAKPVEGTPTNRVAFTGIVFHHELSRQSGPFLVFGNAKISEGAKLNHWAFLSVLGMNYDSFTTAVDGEGWRVGTPNDDGVKRYPGVEEVRYREVPLSEIGTPADLDTVVEASVKSAAIEGV
jgi:hypothetical protein